jgi:hypothetical protein
MTCRIEQRKNSMAVCPTELRGTPEEFAYLAILSQRKRRKTSYQEIGEDLEWQLGKVSLMIVEFECLKQTTANPPWDRSEEKELRWWKLRREWLKQQLERRHDETANGRNQEKAITTVRQ